MKVNKTSSFTHIGNKIMLNFLSARPRRTFFSKKRSAASFVGKSNLQIRKKKSPSWWRDWEIEREKEGFYSTLGSSADFWFAIHNTRPFFKAKKQKRLKAWFSLKSGNFSRQRPNFPSHISVFFFSQRSIGHTTKERKERRGKTMAVVFSFSFSQRGVAKIGNSWGSGREEYTFLHFFFANLNFVTPPCNTESNKNATHSYFPANISRKINFRFVRPSKCQRLGS